MIDLPKCPRCGADGRSGDEVCRRCGTDLPAGPLLDGNAHLPQAPLLGVDRESFSLPWLIFAVVGYVALLFAAFQVFKGQFAQYADMLGSLKTPADVKANAAALSDFALKGFALVFTCYLAGGILNGRFARGRALLQGTLAAPLSWLAVFLQGGCSGPLFLPLLIGAAIVTGTAALGSWVGGLLRPKPDGR